MRKTLVLGVLVLMAATPVAAAQSSGGEDAFDPTFESMIGEVESFGDLTVGVQSKAISFSWSNIQVGPNMSTFLRQTFDETFGDADGNITAEELDAGENLLRVLIQNEFEKYAHQQSASGLLMIDETGPKAAEVTSLVTDGVVGPVASDESITLHFDVRVGFPTFDSDVHTIRLDMGSYYFKSVNESKAAAVAGDFTVTVVGIDGWTIDGSSIQPGCASDNWDEASQSIVYGAPDVNCFTGRSGLIMAFSVTGQEASGSALPGFGMPLLVLGLVGAGLVLRRRL